MYWFYCNSAGTHSRQPDSDSHTNTYADGNHNADNDSADPDQHCHQHLNNHIDAQPYTHTNSFVHSAELDVYCINHLNAVDHRYTVVYSQPDIYAYFHGDCSFSNRLGHEHA